MPEKLYIIILLGVCFIASGFAIDNVILTNQNKEYNNKILEYATELIRLYNIDDKCQGKVYSSEVNK